MHFLALASPFFSLTAMPQLLAASPLKVRGNGDVCPKGFFSVPQCCSTILGVGLDCVNLFPTPNNSIDFVRLRGWEREYRKTHQGGPEVRSTADLVHQPQNSRDERCTFPKQKVTNIGITRCGSDEDRGSNEATKVAHAQFDLNCLNLNGDEGSGASHWLAKPRVQPKSGPG
ncbi:hypothetical protein GGX14DRAFT_594506 [Mycena pura]|uniref:Hydrophobin n=1 Tax=Mycena pura TaxID=153505 RepID=A0AAD6Y3D4_9AGAR|nr:hypothetical protein GGX14DRAFT_594506 [Mycena pura]